MHRILGSHVSIMDCCYDRHRSQALYFICLTFYKSKADMVRHLLKAFHWLMLGIPDFPFAAMSDFYCRILN